MLEPAVLVAVRNQEMVRMKCFVSAQCTLAVVCIFILPSVFFAGLSSWPLRPELSLSCSQESLERQLFMSR